MSRAICGSRQRFNGSRFRVSRAGSGSGRPIAPPSSIAAAAACRAICTECVSARVPQSQLPSAMPPKIAIWYSDSARPTTQRGVDICTVVLNSASDMTQAAPAAVSATPVSHADSLRAVTTAHPAIARKVQRTRASLANRWRACAERKAPITAPTPNAPSSTP